MFAQTESLLLTEKVSAKPTDEVASVRMRVYQYKVTFFRKHAVCDGYLISQTCVAYARSTASPLGEAFGKDRRYHFPPKANGKDQ